MATACGALRARTERTRTHRGGHLHPDTRPQFRTLGLDPVGEESGWAASPGGTVGIGADQAGRLVPRVNSPRSPVWEANLAPVAFGKQPDRGRVDCDLGLPPRSCWSCTTPIRVRVLLVASQMLLPVGCANSDVSRELGLR